MDREAKNCQFYFSSSLQWLQTVTDLGKEELRLQFFTFEAITACSFYKTAESVSSSIENSTTIPPQWRPYCNEYHYKSETSFTGKI